MSQSIEGRLAHYAEMKDEIAAIKATVRSSDRAVTVIAGPGGSVLDVRLAESAFGSGSPQTLGGAINSTLRLAVAEAAKQQAAIVQRYVGDRLNIMDRVMATQQAILGDKIKAGEAEATRRAARDDDEGFSGLGGSDQW